MNAAGELVEGKAVVHYLGIKSADLEEEFLFQSFAGFFVTMMKRNATDCHMFVRVVWEIKVSSDWLRDTDPCHFFERLDEVR